MNERCTAVRPLIHDYLEGELAPARSDAVREHLERCRPCRGHAEAWIEDLHLLLAIDEPAAASHWPALRRKLRWRGPRSTSPVSPWLQILCALAAFAIVFGSVGFLIWLESNERGDGDAIVFDPGAGELSFDLRRGEEVRCGRLALQATSGAPKLRFARVGSSDRWDLEVHWGAVTVRHPSGSIFVAEHEQRWHLPLEAELPTLELELRAARAGKPLGPWPHARVWSGDPESSSSAVIADEQGLCRFELPLRLEPPVMVWARADAESEARALPPLADLLAQRGRLAYDFEIDAVRHVRRVATFDRDQNSVVGVRLEVRRDVENASAEITALSLEPGIAEVPLWFDGPYRYRVLDPQGKPILERTASALPDRLELTAH